MQHFFTKECFFQVVAIYSSYYASIVDGNSAETQGIVFMQNSARLSVSTLYGGLLDRCTVSPLGEVRNIDRQYLGTRDEGRSYFDDTAISKYYDYDRFYNFVDWFLINTNISISSDPVQVCICIGRTFNCTQQTDIIKVKKGETFIASLAAVDQIGHPVDANIQTLLNFTDSGLAEGQLTREIPGECTDLTFNVVSPHTSEALTLYASDGPCNDAEFSIQRVTIQFLPCSCPIGLQISDSEQNATNCTCECHSSISQHVEHCDLHTGLLTKYEQSSAWISFINNSGYLVYTNCPFDYCYSPSPPVNLNQLNGADAQCAFNRSSLLCGVCRFGLSISLGSSQCLSCPSYWPAILVLITVSVVLAGIVLVIVLLALNMTVAVGTLNGLIFYSNIVYASRGILLPFERTNAATVFVSWLNLELGIETCYFPGMDTYTKSWLQLFFPAYVILLVILVIIVCSYSSRFSILIGKKDPVATLATLVLLSYAKLIEVCFKSLSVGILTYPDGSTEMVWLPDATVKYLSGKHIPLFIATVLILLAGLLYTVLLFTWQWLLFFPRWRIFRWTRNPRIQTFIETYHTPYTTKYRYFTGFLLVVRLILYFVAAVNITNNPTITFTSIIFTVCCITCLKQFVGIRMYRMWSIDALETFFYLNILLLVTFTWFTHENPDSDKEAAAYVSVSSTFIVLLLIVFYHVYTSTSSSPVLRRQKTVVF